MQQLHKGKISYQHYYWDTRYQLEFLCWKAQFWVGIASHFPLNTVRNHGFSRINDFSQEWQRSRSDLEFSGSKLEPGRTQPRLSAFEMSKGENSPCGGSFSIWNEQLAPPWNFRVGVPWFGSLLLLLYSYPLVTTFWLSVVFSPTCGRMLSTLVSMRCNFLQWFSPKVGTAVLPKPLLAWDILRF